MKIFGVRNQLSVVEKISKSLSRSEFQGFGIWEFPKIRGALFWGPWHQDPTILGTFLGSPIFGNSHLEARGRKGFKV